MTIQHKLPAYAWLPFLAIVAFMAYTAYTFWVEVKRLEAKNA